MRINRSTIWFLLGYLTLLMNVGPSAHHADFFGFHSHCTADSSPVAVSEPANLGLLGNGCCCDHNHATPLPPSKSEDLGGIEEALRTDNRCSDCLFCQYFDHLHAVSSSSYFDLRETPSCDTVATLVEEILFRTIAYSARGPPAFFLS